MVTKLVITALKARIVAIGLVTEDKFSDEDYHAARRRYLAAYREYAANHRTWPRTRQRASQACTRR
jgi:hypothetical protein